jgi:hypothetical protein
MQSARTKSEAGLLVLVVFLLGILVGGEGYHLWGARVFGNENGPMHNGRGAPPPLGQTLQLSPDQQKSLDAIWADTRAQFQASDAQRNQIRMQTRDKVRAILTPDQLTKFNAMMKDVDAHQRPGDRGPDGRGPGVRLDSVRRPAALDLVTDRAEIMDCIRGLGSNYCVSSSAGTSRRPQQISNFRYDYEREFPVTL